jgi:hypothetical protein
LILAPNQRYQGILDMLILTKKMFLWCLGEYLKGKFLFSCVKNIIINKDLFRFLMPLQD